MVEVGTIELRTSCNQTTNACDAPGHKPQVAVQKTGKMRTGLMIYSMIMALVYLSPDPT